MITLTSDDYAILDEDDFGVPGLVATELIGPFVRLNAVGPLIMVHDGVFEPRHGIGHHPHRYNERLFYILEGAVDHDDTLNQITGHMGTGDMGRLTEGQRGMLHKEWNNTDGRARAFILVYSTDPVPLMASFAVLRDRDAPRYEEAPGVSTKELVGSRATLPIHGDIRFFADTHMDAGSSLDENLKPDEGALLFPVEGEISVGEEQGIIAAGGALVAPPDPTARSIRLVARAPSRVLRTIHGPGHGLVWASS